MQNPAGSVCSWINGEASDAVPVRDRGLAFGDGVFESMRFNGHRIPLLDWHMRRLEGACERLRIPVAMPGLREEIYNFQKHVALSSRESVIKLIVTRGPGERGYRCQAGAVPTRVLQQFALPDVPQAWLTEGVAVRYCDTRLGSNPMLAGIKHLNRLEQVMARLEWTDTHIADGLMADSRGRIVEAISSNLFLVTGGRLLTPPIDTCGVAGVMRQYILDELSRLLSISVSMASCERALLAAAQEVFLCNAVSGVWPVGRIGTKSYAVGPVTRKVQEHVARLFAT